MAMFKVGQRVRLVARKHPADRRPDLILGGVPAPLGTCGTVLRFRDDGALAILFDGYPSEGKTRAWRVMAYQLVPLADPKADEFIERIKKMKVYDEPTVKPRVTVQ